ncbi:hypothetical protein V1527DRAFT_61437 [Lipomyces starkeyi]
MTIPLWHSTTTGSLLSCPQVKSLLGDYPSDIFLRIEERRALPASLSLYPRISSQFEMPVLDRSVTDRLMDMYFRSVNMQHPVLDYDECVTQYHSIVSEPLHPGLQSALVLAMLALADAARTSPPETLDAEWAPGSLYFLPALNIATETFLKSHTTTILLSQCLYLSALYYNFLGRPLDAWRFVHMSSTSFQRLWTRSKHCLEIDEELHHQPFMRLCWAIFALECDLIAEHHLPRSGIENIVDKLPLPLCGDPPDTSLLAWLAELSARRLLNRDHHALYADDHEYLLQAENVAKNAVERQNNEKFRRMMDLP